MDNTDHTMCKNCVIITKKHTTLLQFSFFSQLHQSYHPYLLTEISLYLPESLINNNSASNNFIVPSILHLVTELNN